MFRLLRKNMKKILIVTILLIVPPFVIWGVGNIGNNEGAREVGRIYKRKVTRSQYEQARNACMLNLYLLYGSNFRDLLPMIDLNRQTWDRLLLLAKASRQGIQISDAEVAAQIQKIFRKGDTFDKDRYETFLQQTGLPAIIFEQRVRDTLAIGRLSRLITDTAIVTTDELEEAYRTKGEKAKASYIEFHASDYAAKVSLDEQKEKEYFAKHREDFRVSEKVKVRYVLLTADDFKKGIKVREKEIRDHYDTNQASWIDPSDPKEEKVQPFQTVKEKIRRELIKQKATDAAFEKATDIAMSLFDQPDLEKAAKAVNLKVLHTEFFAPNEPKPPLNSYEFLQTAFNTAVGKNSPVIKISKGFVILSPMEKQPAHLPEFEQAKNLVRERYRSELALAKMLEEAEKIRQGLGKALQEGRETLEDLAKPLGLKVKSTKLFSLDTALEDVLQPDRFKEACFQTKAGSLTGVLQTAQGAFFAYVEKREAGTMDNFPREKDALRAQLLARKKENILSSWYNFLRRESCFEDKTDTVPELRTQT